MTEVVLGDRAVGDGHQCLVVAEIGINHNGDISNARKLIDVASLAGCEVVKFQKRTIDVVYTPEELAKPRESVFGETNGDLKRGLEFGQAEYEEIHDYCQRKPIAWTASCWDEASVDFIDQFDPPFYKIASASLTDDALLRHTRSKGRPIVLSTGMSTLEQIDHAVEVLGREDLVLLHTCSTYPSQYEELNLRVIALLRERYGVPIGYSGHETGIASSVAAVAVGACVVERHITLGPVALGVGSGGVARAQRHLPGGARHPARGEGARRRGEAGGSVRDPGDAEAAAGGALSSVIKAVVMDVDGVLTDGTVWVDEAGRELKRVSFADIMGVSIGRRAGLRFALVSGEGGPVLDQIAAKFGIDEVYRDCKDKVAAVRDFAARHELSLFEICFIGDDVNDVSAMEICGLAVAPGGTPVAGLAPIAVITARPAGNGAVREVIDSLLGDQRPTPVLGRPQEPDIGA